MTATTLRTLLTVLPLPTLLAVLPAQAPHRPESFALRRRRGREHRGGVPSLPGEVRRARDGVTGLGTPGAPPAPATATTPMETIR